MTDNNTQAAANKAAEEGEDAMREAVSDFRKATYEFARGQDPDDHALMLSAQRRIFETYRASRQVANKADVEKAAAWIDQFGNVFPLGAYSPTGKPNYLDADKRGWKPLFRSICVETTELITNFEQAFFVVQDAEGNADFVTRTNAEAQEHINDACEIGVEGAGKWKSIPVFKMVELESIQTMASDNAATPHANKAEVDALRWLLSTTKSLIERKAVRNLDEVISHCEKILATSPATTGASTGWKKLNDVQWMNIVNHDRAYESYSKDDAVHEAVKRTEAKLKELNSSSVGASTVLTDERIAAVFKELGVAGEPMPNTYKFARAIAREVAVQAGQVAVPEILFDGLRDFLAPSPAKESK